MTEPIDAASDVVDQASPDPMEMLMRQEAVKTAVSRFAELPTAQRSVVILKDVLDEQLAEIAALLDLSVDAVKGHLARGRARLRQINAQADDVKLVQSKYPIRIGSADVGMFFSIYASYAKTDDLWLAPAWLEGREVIAVFEDRADLKPSYVMWLEWRDGRISFIRDYRYVRYVTADAELALVPGGGAFDAKPAGDGDER
jgi:RNA polymerase sigma-70 factor (ECF subfamily)